MLHGIFAAMALLAAPTPEEALKVATYYFDGAAEGPVLMESKPCLKVDQVKDSKTKSECLEPAGETVAVNTTVSLWMKFLVPVGGKYDDLVMQVSHEGVVRETKDLKLTESLRLRTWSSSKVTKPGKWTFKVLRSGTELASHDVVAQ